MKRRKKNIDLSPEERVRVLDEAALVEGEGLVVNEDGVWRDGWHGHLPVSGLIAKTNRPTDVLDGAIFWDPAASSVVVVLRDGSRIVVKQGVVDIDGELANGSVDDRLHVAARQRIETAYDDDRCYVSRELVDLSTEGLMTLLGPYGTNAILVDQAHRLPRDAEAVWKVLRELGVETRAL
jgi:hypothetical protein